MMAAEADKTTPTAQDLQSSAAESLAELLENDLPLANWTLSPLEPGILRGQIGGAVEGHTDAQRIADLTAWADLFGVRVETTRRQDHLSHNFHATYAGHDRPVPVYMFTHTEVSSGDANATGGERPARPGELCSCGNPAVTMYQTPEHGEVPYCGVPRHAKTTDEAES